MPELPAARDSTLSDSEEIKAKICEMFSLLWRNHCVSDKSDPNYWNSDRKTA